MTENKLKRMLLNERDNIDAARRRDDAACEARMNIVHQLMDHHGWTWTDIHSFEREN